MKTIVYPAIRYHKTKSPDGRVVHNADQDAALGKEWTSYPPEEAPPEMEAHDEPPPILEVKDMVELLEGQADVEKPEEDAPKKTVKKAKK